MLLVHRRDVVEAIEISNSLQVGLVLDQLFGATVEEADMGINPLNDLAVKFQHEPQDSAPRLRRADEPGACVRTSCRKAFRSPSPQAWSNDSRALLRDWSASVASPQRHHPSNGRRRTDAAIVGL